MSDRIKLRGLDIDLDSLGSEVERRAGTGPDEPPQRADPTAVEAPATNEPPASIVQVLLRSLAEDADVAQGFPPQSHRALGGAVVAAKVGFRKALQPLINEAFAKQKAFNRRLLDTLAALHSENQRLEARVRQLEGQLGRSGDEAN